MTRGTQLKYTNKCSIDVVLTKSKSHSMRANQTKMCPMILFSYNRLVWIQIGKEETKKIKALEEEKVVIRSLSNTNKCNHNSHLQKTRKT